jgi:hypothetical protein
MLRFSKETGEWLLEPHPMHFGDINVWVIPKVHVDD